MSALLIIADGYTLDGTIPARGPWPAVKFRYRPALYEETCEFFYRREQARGKGEGKVVADFLHQHLTGWDVRDAQNEVAPFTPTNIRIVPPHVTTGILEHVLGYGTTEQEADIKN